VPDGRGRGRRPHPELRYGVGHPGEEPSPYPLPRREGGEAKTLLTEQYCPVFFLVILDRI